MREILIILLFICATLFAVTYAMIVIQEREEPFVETMDEFIADERQ